LGKSVGISYAQIADRFEPRIAALEARGLRKLIIDPGISINYPNDYELYTRQQLRVIRRLDTLRRFGYPILIPIPRKQQFGRVAAYITLALEYGADLIRVHDIELACDLAELFDRL
jgi:dihydropteroate synthase